MGCCDKPIAIATGWAYLALGVNEDLSKQRLKICNNCPYKQGNTCKQCGCTLDAKTRLPAEFCPIHKWEAQTTVK